MLVNMNEILRYAEEKGCCVGAFDTPNLEILMAVLRAAEKRNEPVIIQHAQLHEPEMPIRIIGPIMVRMAKEASVPVCAMLDHGEDMDYVRTALELGFSAVASVEAEIGIVTGHEGREFHIEEPGAAYTDPELAARFVRDTGIDALAASVGTVHGFYATQPKLDFDRIEKIKELTGLPLVMHGGSGISAEDTQRAIRCGIRKINYFSYMSNAGVRAVKELLAEKDVKYFHDLAGAAVDGREKDVLSAMGMFAVE